MVFPEKWDGDISKDIVRWTDTATDRLFHSDDKRIFEVVCKFSRFTVDVERLKDDPLEKEGRGILYQKADGGKRNLTPIEKSALMSLYDSYIENLKEKITENTLLIDCHSFPEDISDVDICVGYNEDWSRPSDNVLSLVTSHFEELGYNVGINKPYANSISPETGFSYQSIMIEVNKRIYLNSDEALNQCNIVMQNLYGKLFILKD
jgi:N-formylglutamate amidohydrolase